MGLSRWGFARTSFCGAPVLVGSVVAGFLNGWGGCSEDILNEPGMEMLAAAECNIRKPRGVYKNSRLRHSSQSWVGIQIRISSIFGGD
jgi:hypothetical protein